MTPKLAPPSPPGGEKIEFDGGDVVLLIGRNLGPPWEFTVSLDILAKASPVLKERLDETYAGESIGLDDEDPHAWSIILDVLHKRGQESSDGTAGKRLVSLATLCEKYDLVHLFRDEIDGWLRQMEQSGVKVEILDRFWVYWVFGYALKAKETMALAINTLRRDTEGRWICSDSGSRLVENRPSGILAHLKHRRTAKLSTFNDAFGELMTYPDKISCKAVCTKVTQAVPNSLREVTELAKIEVVKREIRESCRRHIMLQMYEMAQPYFRRYTEGAWRESHSRDAGMLCGVGDVAKVVVEMEAGLEPFVQWAASKSIEHTGDLERASGDCSSSSTEPTSHKRSGEEGGDSFALFDHRVCIPTEGIHILGQNLLFGGPVLARYQVEYLIGQEKKRTGAESSEYSIEDLLKEVDGAL